MLHVQEGPENCPEARLPPEESSGVEVVVAADSVPVDVPDQFREFEATGGHDGVRGIR